FSLAGYLMRRKQFEEAISLFNEFLAMDPGWQDPKKAGGYFMLGLIYEARKMQKESETAFRASLALHPDPWMEKEINNRL
ncbi:MAG: tetratricopeptide repeat protein, partial [Proteobacteria bacterium]|nr:tetratricopeptide repeat protein [Pseudomonadota bacterium]